MSTENLNAAPIQFYKATGAWHPIIFGFLPIGLVLAALAGALYQWIVNINPFIYVNFLLSIGTGFAVGLIAVAFTKLSKCRNSAIAAIFALCLAAGVLAGGFYVSYRHYRGLYRQAMTAEISKNQNAGNLPAEIKNALLAAVEPSFVEVVKARKEIGWQIGLRSSKSRFSLTGAAVYLLWLLEALIIAGLGVLIGSGSASLPFCEACGLWADHKVDLAEYPIASNEPAADLLRSGTLAQLIAKPPEAAHLGELAKQFLRYTLYVCPKCEKAAFLNITHVEQKLDRHGKEKTEKRDLFKNVAFHDAAIDRLLEIHNPSYLDQEHKKA